MWFSSVGAKMPFFVNKFLFYKNKFRNNGNYAGGSLVASVDPIYIVTYYINWITVILPTFPLYTLYLLHCTYFRRYLSNRCALVSLFRKYILDGEQSKIWNLFETRTAFLHAERVLSYHLVWEPWFVLSLVMSFHVHNLETGNLSTRVSDPGWNWPDPG